jgi:hypothetical protein
VFREIAVESKKKGQKDPAVVEVPNHHRSMQYNAEVEPTSPEEESDSDKEE